MWNFHHNLFSNDAAHVAEFWNSAWNSEFWGTVEIEIFHHDFRGWMNEYYPLVFVRKNKKYTDSKLVYYSQLIFRLVYLPLLEPTIDRCHVDLKMLYLHDYVRFFFMSILCCLDSLILMCLLNELYLLFIQFQHFQQFHLNPETSYYASASSSLKNCIQYTTLRLN